MASVTAIEITVNGHVFRLTLEEAAELREQLNLVTKKESITVTRSWWPSTIQPFHTLQTGQ